MRKKTIAIEFVLKLKTLQTEVEKINDYFIYLVYYLIIFK
jgi:hypothetical protein